MTVTLGLLALCLSAATIASAVYVFQGDPYQPGPLSTSSFTLEKGEGGIPEHTLGTRQQSGFQPLILKILF